MATKCTSLPVFMALAAAPLPRPPQPINPTLITSLPAAWTLRANGKAAQLVDPRMAARCRNCRRDSFDVPVALSFAATTFAS
jgi:hypothetical protein